MSVGVVIEQDLMMLEKIPAGRTARRPALLKAANGTVTNGLSSFVIIVLPEDERDAGNSGDICFVLVRAGDSMVSTDCSSASTVVLPEDERDERRCKPCFVFSQ